MAEKMNLPGSSFDELKKIIMAYASLPDKATTDEVGKLASVHSTTISRNAKFLVDIGILTGGAQKAATELGRSLGRAIEHGVVDDEREFWQEAVSKTERVSSLVTTVRIKGGMQDKALSDHILYVSGASNNHANRTGARCVVDVLLAARLLTESDGNLKVATAAPKTTMEPIQEEAKGEPANVEKDSPVHAESSRSTAGKYVVEKPSSPQITINIQLQIPEAKDPDTYEKLFKAMRDNLFPNEDDE